MYTMKKKSVIALIDVFLVPNSTLITCIVMNQKVEYNNSVNIIPSTTILYSMLQSSTIVFVYEYDSELIYVFNMLNIK